MRVFVAIDPSEEVRARLAGVQEKLSSACRGSARWIAPQSIHITLKFIGEVEAERIGLFDRALAGVRWRPFTIAVRELGLFPKAHKPRILWAGLEAPPLAPLAREIESALQKAGVPREERAFRPHITLARGKDQAIRHEVVAAVRDITDSDFGTFVADRFYLVDSVLKAGGSVYTKIGEYKAS